MENSAKYLNKLQQNGEISFTSKDYSKALDISDLAATHSLLRLRKQHVIATPRKGFHVILKPSDYKSGCRPADEFIDYLMKYLNSPYYVSLLSAAEIYGAAHHKPQTFQVMTSINRRPVICGNTKINFYAKSNIKTLALHQYKVSTGYIKVSSPEVTAFDLVAYQDASGGLDNVSTVINELAENINKEKIKLTSKSFSVTVSQRLGFILEMLGHEKLARAIELGIENKIRKTAALVPSESTKNSQVSKRWKLAINEIIEPEV